MGADHRAFLEVTLPHLDVVYQVARHAAGDGQEPEDLVQETYLQALDQHMADGLRTYLNPPPGHLASRLTRT